MSSPKLCYAPPAQWPHPPHQWFDAVPVPSMRAPVAVVPHWCDGGAALLARFAAAARAEVLR